MTPLTPRTPIRRHVGAVAGLGVAAALVATACAPSAGAAATQGSAASPTTYASGTSKAADAPDTSATGITLTLPAPTGRMPIGTVALHLVDRSRPDPLLKSRPYRELMVSVWYPARKPANLPLAPYMQPLAAADWDQKSAPALEIPTGSVDWAGTRTHARAGAPVAGGRFPVVVFSSGDGGTRTLGTTLVEQLASRGYIVVTVDFTYEADQVEFPGGRLERAVPLPEDLNEQVIAELLKTHSEARVVDMKFVLDQLTRLNAGDNPDADGAPLPTGLSGALNLSRVGMLGQSMGGSTAAQLVHDDPRVDAGVNLDGELFGSVAETGVAKPFLVLARESHTRQNDPTWKSFWDKSTGWKRELRFAGAQHGSFTDLQTIFPQVAAKLKKVPEAFGELIGTIDPQRSISAQRDYVTAFFDLQLKGQRTRLFDAPAKNHPEVTIVP